jgi:hypothetical protein
MITVSQDFHRSLGNVRFKFYNIAVYIRHNFSPTCLSQQDIMRISMVIYGNCTNESIQMIVKSLRSYDIVSFVFEICLF